MAILSKSLKVKMAFALVGCSMLACSKPSGSVVRGLMLKNRDIGGMDAANGGNQKIRYNGALSEELPTGQTSVLMVPDVELEEPCDKVANPLCRSGEDMRNAIVEEANFRAKFKGSSVAKELEDPEVISFANRFWKKPTYSAKELRQEAKRIEKELDTAFKTWLEMKKDSKQAFPVGLEEYAELARQVVDEEAEEMELVGMGAATGDNQRINRYSAAVLDKTASPISVLMFPDEDEKQESPIEGNDSESNAYAGEISAFAHTDVLAKLHDNQEQIAAERASEDEISAFAHTDVLAKLHDNQKQIAAKQAYAGEISAFAHTDVLAKLQEKYLMELAANMNGDA